MRRPRRLPVALAGALALALAGAPPAWAHGIGGRVDLPVPRALFVWGAVAALVISFVALAALWREPRLEGDPARPVPGELLQRLLTAPGAEWAVRALSLAAFLLVVLAALTGPASAGDNFAPLAVYVWFWVGLVFAHALLGNLWATCSPLDTLARLLALGEEPRWRYPKGWGVWPAGLLLFAFVWLELVAPFGASPRVLGVAAVAYAALSLAGMAAFGRDAWTRGGEAFAVYFALLARIAPLARDGRGRVVLRPPLAGLPGIPPRPGLVAFVAVLLGSTSFDGFSRSKAWLGLTGALSPGVRVLAGTGALLAAVLLVAGVYAAAMAFAAAVGGARWHPLAVRFVHSLVPIAFAYAVAHYFSLLVLEGQLGLRFLSDPFGRGWDLLGTAGWSLNLALVSATTIWYVQVAAIVAGHVGGVVLAHDRAVAVFPAGVAVGTQYALLAAMVLFTVGGLLILSGG